MRVTLGELVYKNLFNLISVDDYGVNILQPVENGEGVLDLSSDAYHKLTEPQQLLLSSAISFACSLIHVVYDDIDDISRIIRVEIDAPHDTDNYDIPSVYTKLVRMLEFGNTHMLVEQAKELGWCE
jgi:hypothetical protein